MAFGLPARLRDCPLPDMSFGKAVILGSFLASSQQASEWPDYSGRRLGVETRGTWTIARGCRFEGSAILLADVCGLGDWTITDNLGEECGRGIARPLHLPFGCLGMRVRVRVGGVAYIAQIQSYLLAALYGELV
jgi:hypothetical protein